LILRHEYAGFTICCPQGFRRMDCAAIVVWQAKRGRMVADGVESGPAGGNAGATPIPTAKSDPLSRPEAP
jgi:hypothetical protein